MLFKITNSPVFKIAGKPTPFLGHVGGDDFVVVCETGQAEELCARHICLPVSAITSEEQARYVIQSLQEALERVPVAV